MHEFMDVKNQLVKTVVSLISKRTHINALCVETVQFLNVKRGGTSGIDFA